MVGKPVIKGTRIPVELILKMLSQGIPTEEIQAALAYAALALEMEVRIRPLPYSF